MKISAFTKVFIYTISMLTLVCVTAFVFFFREFLNFYREDQQRKFNESFRPFITAVQARQGINQEQIRELALTFAQSNQNLSFMITAQDGTVVYNTANTGLILSEVNYSPFQRRFISDGQFVVTPEDGGIAEKIKVSDYVSMGFYNNRTDSVEEIDLSDMILVRTQVMPENEDNSFSLLVSEQLEIPLGREFNSIASMIDVSGAVYNYVHVLEIDYSGLIRRSLFALLIILAIAVLGAALFAKKVTRPLEEEIVRRRIIEENQRLFFSAASHELKTPIASARALVEGMAAGLGEYRDYQKYLRECLKTFDAQTHLVSEILEIVKLSDNEVSSLSLSEINLAQTGNAVLDEYRPLAENRQIAIHGEFPQVCVKADGNRLRLVISNVIANAVQNTPENGYLRIETEEKKKIRLRIINSGTHIPEELLGKIFEPFYRADTARTQYNARSGLGLAIVKKALDSMDIPFGLENIEDGVLFWMEMNKGSGQ